MSLFKRIILILISVVAVAALSLRVLNIKREESSNTIFSNLDGESEFVAAVYSPITDKIVLDDSTNFSPGKIYIQDAVKLKHHFYIFSSYYEKSASNAKEITYQSEGNSNKSMVVFTADRNDITFQEVALANENLPNLEFYNLYGQLLNAQNQKFDVANYDMHDTLKFYLKMAHIKPFKLVGVKDIVSEYNLHTIILDKEPVDSLFFVRKK